MMATIYFIVTAALGLGLTAAVLVYFRNRGKLTDNQYALIFTIGLSFTWFSSFLAPFLAPKSSRPSIELTIFALANSVCFGLLTYIIVCVVLAAKRKKK